MRVIAGSARGLKLSAPAGHNTRPTTDRVKEALFSIISSRHTLQGAQVLDICAGTGALGIEALSRGALSGCFVEHDRSVAKILEKNLASAGFVDRSVCLVADVVKGLQMLSRQEKRFDLIFFDPPYASGLYGQVFSTLLSLNMLEDGALLVAESSARNVLDDRYGPIVKIDRRIYGEVSLEFFVREHP